MATQVVAGELYESITGQLFEIGRQLRQKNGYPFDAERLKQALQDVIEGRFPKRSFELYSAPGQWNDSTMKGFDLEKHLEETGLINRAFSLDHPLVKGWIENPSTYPEEFKNKAIFLWKSKRASGSSRSVADLIWHDERVIVDWCWLGGRWDGDDPALLASS